MSPSHGNLTMSWIELDCSRPAMAKLWPLASSMVVEARRVRIAGIVTTAVEVSGTLTDPAADSSLTSGATLRLMRSPMIVGVKARLTPTCLYCTVMVPTRVPPCGTISGISPPARKLAVSPDMAIRLGSARMVAWLWVARKSIRVLSPLSEVWNLSAPEATPPVEEMVLTAKPPSTAPVPNRAMLLMFCQLMPTRFSASRLTSATLTRSWTWVGASILMLLITLSALPLTCCRASRLASSATAVERALDAAERRGHAHDGVEQHAVLGIDGIEHGVARLLGEDIDHGGRADLDVGDVGGGHEHRGGGAGQLERRALIDLERERRRFGRHHLALAERPARRATGDHRRRRASRPRRRRLDRHRGRRRCRRLGELRRRSGRGDGCGRLRRRRVA